MMRNLLIIYPHWVPSNLTGVHRPRLIANFIERFGWHPIVLSVHYRYYEEPLDWDLVKLVRPNVEVFYSKALPVPKPRIFGDIGIRGFYFLLKETLKIVEQRKIDFIWIPMPSFYTSLIGRIIYEKKKIPYGLDYIDPWIRDLTGRRNLRAVLSNWVARILEPIAIKKALLITGVSEKYFLPAIERNFSSDNKPFTLAFPYGFDPNDHKVEPSNFVKLWEPGEKVLFYAGAFLPKSVYFFEKLFETLADNKNLLSGIKFVFLGTGYYSVREIAQKYGIEKYVKEINQRLPYLNVLKLLSLAYAVLVIGTTQQHYTASKIFQALMSKRPVFAMFHKSSSTVDILKTVNADDFLVIYDPDHFDEQKFKQDILLKFEKIIFQNDKIWNPDLELLKNKFSAENNAKLFADTLNKILALQNQI